MKSFLKKRAKKKRVLSSSFIHPEEKLPAAVKFSLMEYNSNQLTVKENASLGDCLTSIEAPSMSWIKVCGVTEPLMINQIGEHFKLHPLILENIRDVGHRLKIEIYQDQIFIVGRMLLFDAKHELKDEQVGIVFGKNYLIFFCEEDNQIFHDLQEKIRQPQHRIRTLGSDYLAYCLLDAIVDHYFTVLEVFDLQLEQLEEELMKNPDTSTLQKIQHVKRELIFLRRSIWPMREVLNQFQHLDSPLVNHTTQVYARDVYDHTVQAISIVEGFRDVVAGLLDLHLSNMNMNLNEIVKVLTIVSTIFVPLSFITSIYGMNFEYMPEIQAQWGYPLVIIILIVVAITMVNFFHRRGWLRA